MRMTTLKLICFRLFNVTLGRFAGVNRLARLFLLKRHIFSKTPRERYTASSRYFQVTDLNISGKDK